MEIKAKNAVSSFEESFCSLPSDEQCNVLSAILFSNEYLRWKTKILLNSVETQDLLTLLPPEIQLMILSFIDGTSLLKACEVSKKWNKLIKSFDSLWKQKSIEIGVNIKEKPAKVSWNKAFILSKKQLHFLKYEKAFSEKYIALQDSNNTIKAIDYHDGYICTVSKSDTVYIWHLVKNIPVLTFNVYYSVSCIKFRPYSTLVCGHFSGLLTSWDLSEMETYCLRYYGFKTFPDRQHDELNFVEFSLLKNKFKTHSGPVFTCDFSDELELLISGGGDGSIKFWNLRTGENLYSIYSQMHWILKVCLIIAPAKRAHILLTMTKDTIEKYEWPSGCYKSQVSSSEGKEEEHSSILNKIEKTGSVKVSELEDMFTVPGFQINSNFIGLVLQDLQEKQSTFSLYDLDTFDMKVSVPLNFKVRKFLALGDRFGMFLSTGKELYTSTLVVVDIFSGQVVGRHSIPHTKMTTPDGAQLVVGDTRWLNGLRGWEFFEGRKVDLEDVYSEDGEMKHSGMMMPLSSINCINKYKERFCGRSCDSLVLATGLQLREGTFFTLWWGIDKENKTKVD